MVNTEKAWLVLLERTEIKQSHSGPRQRKVICHIGLFVFPIHMVWRWKCLIWEVNVGQSWGENEINSMKIEDISLNRKAKVKEIMQQVSLSPSMTAGSSHDNEVTLHHNTHNTFKYWI